MERFPPRPQASAIFLAVGVEPTRQTPLILGFSYQVPGMERLPWMMLTTPGGSSISWKISPIFCMKSGDWVEGL